MSPNAIINVRSTLHYIGTYAGEVSIGPRNDMQNLEEPCLHSNPFYFKGYLKGERHIWNNQS